jgi:hypothetical protein
VLAYTAFPRAHWRKIWSTNPLERINKEIKRRSNVVGIFPDDASVIRLVGAVLLDQHDDWAIAERRYLSEESMAAIDHDPEEITTTEPPRCQPRNVSWRSQGSQTYFHHSTGHGGPGSGTGRCRR